MIGKCLLMMEIEAFAAKHARWLVPKCEPGAAQVFGRPFGVVHSPHLSGEQERRLQ
jgi:hypothetical protein